MSIGLTHFEKLGHFAHHVSEIVNSGVASKCPYTNTVHRLGPLCPSLCRQVQCALIHQVLLSCVMATETYGMTNLNFWQRGKVTPVDGNLLGIWYGYCSPRDTVRLQRDNVRIAYVTR